jgi:hypothetical protein
MRSSTAEQPFVTVAQVVPALGAPLDAASSRRNRAWASAKIASGPSAPRQPVPRDISQCDIPG